MSDASLRGMGMEGIQPLVDLAREHDQDVQVVLVLHGSPDRGLALSLWTRQEEPDSFGKTVSLIRYALSDENDRLTQ